MDQPARISSVPRQPRALETRRRLLECVETLVAAHGPAAVTTTRLAAETGVSVGTIYRYFADRDALLLSAYDATVERIVAECAASFGKLPGTLSPTYAARALLGSYLAAASAIPAHAGLLAAMRATRPIEADQHGDNEPGIVARLFLPFLARYLPPGTTIEPARLGFLSVMVGTMVDLYLVTPEVDARTVLRAEIDAHVSLMVERLGA